MQFNSYHFIHLSIHSFSKYTLNAYFMPGVRNIVANKNTAFFLGGGRGLHRSPQVLKLQCT